MKQYLVALVLSFFIIGISSQVCDPVCQNGGTCLNGNSCNCNTAPGWTGSRCETPICSGGCGFGTCVSPNVCSCQQGYNGTNCNNPICDPPCLHGGVCVGPDSCQCNTPTSGWSGPTCNVPECPLGCGTGTCIAPSVCDCTNPDWTGDRCQTPVCTPPCQNGACTGVDACTCNNGWTGTLCEVAVCTPACLNGGRCTFPPNECDCSTAPGWNGTYCDSAICENRICVHGYCSGPDICNCEGSGYSGDQCQFDINECAQQGACDPLTTCTNTDGDYTCTPCPDRYVGTGKTGCTWDACAWGACSPVAPCTQDLNAQTWDCGDCPSGYTGDGVVCDDINECNEQGACDPLTECTNTDGSYECTDCPEGYTGDGKTGCESTEDGDGGDGDGDGSSASVVAAGLAFVIGAILAF